MWIMSIESRSEPLFVHSQLRFARSELRRGLAGVSEADGRRRLLPMNSISWIVGHLAWQEQGYWLWFTSRQAIVPELDELVGYGKPASTPPLAEMWAAWEKITTAADAYLSTLEPADLTTHLVHEGRELRESIGTMLLRVIYHYWYHIGEALAVRQMLGHEDLPQFVGPLGRNAPYRGA
jgi:uncharacterized damage-inducible protein DinB